MTQSGYANSINDILHRCEGINQPQRIQVNEINEIARRAKRD